MFYLVDNVISYYNLGCTCFTLCTRFSKGDGMIGVLWVLVLLVHRVLKTGVWGADDWSGQC